MRYAWKLSRLRHLIFDTDRPIVLGGRAMALDHRNRRIRGKVISASPKVVVLKTSRGAHRGPPGRSHPSKPRRARRSMCRPC